MSDQIKHRQKGSSVQAAVHVLDAEIRTYRLHRQELLQHDAGRWVLIHDSEVLGCFDTQKAALSAGRQRFKGEAFLAHQIDRAEPVFEFTAFELD